MKADRGAVVSDPLQPGPAGRVLVYALLFLFSAIFAAPFFWLVTSAVKRPEQLMAYPIQWIPDPVVWSNFREGWSFRPFSLYLRNTLYVAVLSTIGSVLSSSLVAYGLTRIEWPGRRLLFVTLIGTMMLPGQVVMVPLFALFVRLGWVDTFKPLWVPTFFAGAFYVYLLRGFFQAIPRDLSEAATIDGASEWVIYWRIVMPLARPALATVGLFAFIGAWNDFVGPLIYIVNENNYTLALGLSMFRGQYGTYWHYLLAVSTLVTIPIVVLFFFTQRTFIQGITMTGLKG
ncbi:MAG: sn-glycerol-3-phosphate transport system permease protein UgpE [Armatimonadota bacterium]|nr:MAG: sn-glycerol-3-phosphate transport system permease protein UgpE [Armatimonadota bacterium]